MCAMCSWLVQHPPWLVALLSQFSFSFLFVCKLWSVTLNSLARPLVSICPRSIFVSRVHVCRDHSTGRFSGSKIRARAFRANLFWFCFRCVMLQCLRRWEHQQRSPETYWLHLCARARQGLLSALPVLPARSTPSLVRSSPVLAHAFACPFFSLFIPILTQECEDQRLNALCYALPGGTLCALCAPGSFNTLPGGLISSLFSPACLPVTNRRFGAPSLKLLTLQA